VKSFDDAVIYFLLNYLKFEKENFKLILTFLLYLRENINKLNAPDYTSSSSCEEIPGYINTYFIFLENNKFFNENNDKAKIMIIELMFKFCAFLKEKNFTTKSMSFIKKFKK
jgi:hypothetical protein